VDLLLCRNDETLELIQQTGVERERPPLHNGKRIGGRGPRATPAGAGPLRGQSRPR
jgi:hypothetical protein